MGSVTLAPIHEKEDGLLIDADRAEHLYSVMGPAIETSGGSAGNTAAGLASFGGSAACEFGEGYDPTIKAPEPTEFCVRIARRVVGDDNVDTNVAPCMGAEDFGAFLMQRPGCFIFMGQAETDEASNHNHGLHTPAYDFNDDIIPLGIEYWTRLVEAALPLDK